MLNTLGFFLLLNTSSWMYDYRDIVYPKTLNEITIPGTHDSASYNLSRDKYIDIPEIYRDIIKFGELLKLPISDIIHNWTKTQNMDIYGQLEMGSRYIDLRLCFYKNAWYSHHNFVVGSLLTGILDQIYAFLYKKVDLKFSPFSGTMAVIQYLSVIPSQPSLASLTIFFSFISS